MSDKGNIPAAKTPKLDVGTPCKSCIWCGSVDVGYEKDISDVMVGCSQGVFEPELASVGAIRQLSIQACKEFYPSRSGLVSFGYPKATLDSV
jgi:hypothetical protein